MPEPLDPSAYREIVRQALAEDVGAGDITSATHVLESADSALAAVAGQDGKWSAPPAQQGVIAYRLARLALATGAGMDAVGQRIDAGLKAADKALAASPTDADALDARGSLRYLQWLLGLTPGDADKAVISAEADLTASIKTNPAQASAMNTLRMLSDPTRPAITGLAASPTRYAVVRYPRATLRAATGTVCVVAV